MFIVLHERGEEGEGCLCTCGRGWMRGRPWGRRRRSRSPYVQQSVFFFITLHCSGEPIHVVALYRPPRINKQEKIILFFEELRNLLNSLPQNSKVILCGDMNVIICENLLAEFGFTKCIDKVTRSDFLVDALVESCIDHIYIRAPTLKINSAVIQHKISDHYMISVAVEWKRTPVDVPVDGGGRRRDGACALASTSPRACPAHSPNVTSQRGYMLDNRAVCEKLLSVNFEELMLFTCPIKLYDAFRNIFQQIYNSRCIKKSN